MQRKHSWPRLMALGMSWYAGVALAHHTYSMFDTSRELSVSGVVAKFEWKNPHTFLWVYVPSAANPGQHETWAVENGAPFLLTKRGWSKDSVRQDDKVTVTYAPLRDGRQGGHCLKIILPGGRSLECQGLGPPSPAAVKP
jgi:hypothetical protein